MVRYDTEIRKPEDILSRSSRPQRSSFYVPRGRDWRYATGVFRHEDVEDARKESTIWDVLDRDFHVEDAVRVRENSGREGTDCGVSEEGSWYRKNQRGEHPKADGEETTTPSPWKKTKFHTNSSEEDDLEKGSRATRVDLFEASENTNGQTGEPEYKQIGLVVRLKSAYLTPDNTPNILAKSQASPTSQLDRRSTPTTGFRASSALPTPPSTVKSVITERNAESTSTKCSTLRDDQSSSYIKINTSDETVTANVVFPVRDIFTFPLLAMIAMAGEGMKMGLKKALLKEKKRKGEDLMKAKLLMTGIPDVKSDSVPKSSNNLYSKSPLRAHALNSPISNPRKRAFGDEHHDGYSKKPKMPPLAGRAWHRGSAHCESHTSTYHSSSSQEKKGSQTGDSIRYPAEATQPYQQSRPSLGVLPYRYAQYSAPSSFVVHRENRKSLSHSNKDREEHRRNDAYGRR